MAFSPQEQLKDFLSRSHEVLLVLPENPTGDNLAAAFGFYLFLRKRGLLTDLACSGNFPEKFSFLPRPENIINTISGARDFVLSFDTTENKITSLRSEEKEGLFNIYLTPEKGTINPKDFSFILAKFRYDLIITLGASDLESLGKIYFDNAELFFEVPVVNLDIQGSNERFGQINILDVTASSVSELTYQTIEIIEEILIDQVIAFCFLTGIMSATERFQKSNTTPKTLLTAATLMQHGADSQEIIRWLYKTQPLPLLKLWGRAMSNLHLFANTIWAPIGVDDLVQSRATIKEIPLILEKLAENYSDSLFFVLIFNDTPNSSVAMIKARSQEYLIQAERVLGGVKENSILKLTLPTARIEAVGESLSEKLSAIL